MELYADLERTGWFPMSINPVRNGLYEVMHAGVAGFDVMNVYEWRDGHWYFYGETVESPTRIRRLMTLSVSWNDCNVYWRGLTEASAKSVRPVTIELSTGLTLCGTIKEVAEPKNAPMFKVGDKVRVLRKFTEPRGPHWIKLMDDTVGKTGIVKQVNACGQEDFTLVEFEGSDHCWIYKNEVLELVEPKNLPKFKVGDKVRIRQNIVTHAGLPLPWAGQEGVVEKVFPHGTMKVSPVCGGGDSLYFPDQVELVNEQPAPPKFKVGDKVRVLRKFSGPPGWPVSMDNTVGKTGTVVSEPYGGCTRVEFDDPDNCWTYKNEVLELVEDQKPAVTIEVGKFYKSLGGHKVRIYALDGANDEVHGAYQEEGKGPWYVRSYCAPYLDSLVPWVEPHPAESWPVDAKIRVRGKETEEWKSRHFAKFQDGKVFAWTMGRTSFSSEGTDPIEWSFAELVEA